uniref:NACHT domain-containing protein n=1 Tax=Sinocyclocheilus rhinocerous TaxID=307959 RepID=A0A673K1T4_9TELE
SWSLLSEYAYITEYTSRAGEQVLLNDRYTDPLIIQKHREKKERETEMRSRGERFFNTRETNQRNQNIRLDQLFGPENGSKKVPRKAVILQGDSGSGKSVTAQKIVLNWASGELYAGFFDVAFHLRCKELNGLSAEMSLLDLLDCSLTPNEIGQILKDIPQRILFIIDGFDELMLSGTKESLPPKPDIKSHSQAIVCSLLKGRMMRESFLLVTTRSTAVDKLENVLKKPQCFVEIMGFSEKGVSEYFRKFFEDEEFSSQVYEQVKIHEMLYTACFIPVICWIICTIFKRKGKDGVVTSELTTTTSIFVDFVLTLLKHHSSLNQHDELNLLKDLGQLAESGTPKRQVLFSRNNLPKAISDLPNIPFLCTFHQQERTYLKEMFGFLHLSFQEFFTALFYMLTDKAEAKIKVKQLLESAGNGRRNEHLLPVIRFLFGLSNKKVSRLIPGEHPKSTSTVIRALLEKWISKVIEKNIMDTFYMSDFILHCLYELQDREILKNVMKLWERSGINIHWSLKGFSSQVYEQVKIHEMLYTACFIPVICWIICTIFKRKGKDGVVTSELTTTTSIFVDFVLTLLKHHSSLNQHDELNLLKDLGQLAESGTPKRQVLFSRNNLPKAISDLPNIPFLCTFHQQERTYLKEMFGFLHLSFQEFFTALFYMLTDKAEAKIKVKQLLESAGNGRRNEHLLPVIRFLFGLSNKKVSRLIPGEHPKSTSTVIRALLEKWISKVIEKNIMDTFYMSDFILHCLYELQDREILKNVMKLWERSGINIHWSLKGVDCQVVMYCLQYSSRIMSMKVKSNAKDLKMLHPVLCSMEKRPMFLSLSDESVQKILKTLSGQTSVGNIRLVVRSISNANVDLTMNFLVKEKMGRRFR